jgi:hypothetical protein
MRCSFVNDDIGSEPCNARRRIYIPLLGERRLFCANTGYRCETSDGELKKSSGEEMDTKERGSRD